MDGRLIHDVDSLLFDLHLCLCHVQLRSARLDDPEQLFSLFRSNQVVGGIVMASTVAGRYSSIAPAATDVSDMIAAVTAIC